MESKCLFNVIVSFHLCYRQQTSLGRDSGSDSTPTSPPPTDSPTSVAAGASSKTSQYMADLMMMITT